MSKGFAGKPKVAFVCVHNSCRSQIAEALGKKLASDVFESYSAGTELNSHSNKLSKKVMLQMSQKEIEMQLKLNFKALQKNLANLKMI